MPGPGRAEGLPPLFSRRTTTGHPGREGAGGAAEADGAPPARRSDETKASMSFQENWGFLVEEDDPDAEKNYSSKVV